MQGGRVRALRSESHADAGIGTGTPMELSLIVPAHNEEARLGPTVERYVTAFEAVYGDCFELLVVSNGSTDRTCQIVRAAQHQYSQLRLVEISSPVGKGGAILEGFRRAQGRSIVFTDADGATASESLLALAEGLQKHDVVIGSRRMTGSVISRRQPLLRRVLGRAFIWTTRLLFGLPYLDTQCGAKAFRSDVARRVVDLVKETHWTFDLDLLLTCRELGVDVAEYPVQWADQPGSRLRVGATFATVVASLWRLSYRYTSAPPEVCIQQGTPQPVVEEPSCEPTFAYSRL